MAREDLSHTALVGALRDFFSDFSDLMRKELRLAKAEVTNSVTAMAKGGAWMAIAGIFGLIAFLFLLQAAVFGLAALGMGLHWAALIVAAVLVAIAAGCFFYGRSLTRESVTPTRAMQQINRDISAMREQLS